MRMEPEFKMMLGIMAAWLAIVATGGGFVIWGIGRFAGVW